MVCLVFNGVNVSNGVFERRIQQGAAPAQTAHGEQGHGGLVRGLLLLRVLLTCHALRKLHRLVPCLPKLPFITVIQLIILLLILLFLSVRP